MATERQMIKEYRAMGSEDLGYEGDRLATFIEERIKEWKAEKAADRDAQKELELARLAHTLEMEKVRVEARINVRDDASSSSGGTGRPFIDHRMVQINMPRFNDKEGAIDDFLVQFEKLAHAHQVPEQHWAINVSAFLQGAAREVYHGLAAEEADDYNALKKALLCHYRLTAETYRKLFRDSAKKVTETHSQFHNRVRGLFEKWMKMAEVERTYDGLREVILKEHVLGTYRRELTVFLAEREHRTLEEIASMAERYEQAHSKSGGSGGADRPRPSESRRVGEVEPAVRNRQGDGKVGGAPTGRDATYRPGQASPTKPGLASRRGPPTCFNCKRLGHFARDCPKGRQTQVNVVAREECVPEASRNPANLAAATVNGEGATILYDTGCSVPALVDQKYVKLEDYTGEVIEIQYANCARDSLPVAVIDLDSPYVKGKIEAACLEGLSHDVILGCRYMLPQPNPETCTPMPVNAVETRAIREHNRQREVQRKQRAEAIRLAKGRDRLRREREQLEKERLEAQRLERLRLEQLERERIGREQEEKRRLEKLRLQEEQQRRVLKRAFEMHESREYRGRESREQGGFWSEPKRAAASDRYDQPTNRIEPDNRGYNRDDRLSSRASGVAKDNFERKVERCDRRDGRPIEADGNRRFERDRDSGPMRRESNSREHRVDDSFSDRSHDRGGREMHEDRRDIVYRDSHRSRDGERRENISGHRQESDRRNIRRFFLSHTAVGSCLLPRKTTPYRRGNVSESCSGYHGSSDTYMDASSYWRPTTNHSPILRRQSCPMVD